MSASKHLKVLSVRLPESEVRRFKSLAASRGVSLQEAVHRALKKWALEEPAAPAEPLARFEGSLADVGIEDLMRKDRGVRG